MIQLFLQPVLLSCTTGNKNVIVVAVRRCEGGNIRSQKGERKDEKSRRSKAGDPKEKLLRATTTYNLSTITIEPTRTIFYYFSPSATNHAIQLLRSNS